MQTINTNKNRTAWIWVVSALLFLRGVYKLSRMIYIIYTAHSFQLTFYNEFYIFVVVWVVLSFLYSLVYLAAGILLYKMKRVAYYYVLICSTEIVLFNLFSLLYRNGYFGIVQIIPPIAIFAAIVLYVRGLYKKGVLQ